MIEVGAVEARTHLCSLLDKVAQGDEVLITRHGLPVARLVPTREARRANIGHVIDRLRTIRSGVTLGSLDWKGLRDDGRR